MGEEMKNTTIYYKPIMKWYKKLWYFITFRKNKIPKYQEINNIIDINIKEDK